MNFVVLGAVAIGFGRFTISVPAVFGRYVTKWMGREHPMIARLLRSSSSLLTCPLDLNASTPGCLAVRRLRERNGRSGGLDGASWGHRFLSPGIKG